MIEILPLTPERAAEARQVIYQTAHAVFHTCPTLEETLAVYAAEWPLEDVLAFETAYVANGGGFFVTLDEGQVIGAGGLRFLEPGVAEIKRVWLLPAYQGQGLGYAMLQRLLALARELGYAKVRLETAPHYQPRAYALYRRLGFSDIPRYGDDPEDIGMELTI
jgi:ribosomal protein S18 acetylase RimI-like enzyme